MSRPTPVLTVALVLAALMAACTSQSPGAPEDAMTLAAPASEAASEDDVQDLTADLDAEPTAAEAEPTTAAPQAQPIVATTAGDPMEPGRYETDLLSLDLRFTSSLSFSATDVQPGKVVLERWPAATGRFTALGFFAVDTLVASDALGRTRSRVPATTDLGAFLGTLQEGQVVATDSFELGGRAANSWTIAYPQGCDDCVFETLFNVTGFQNLWGTFPDVVQEIITIDAPVSPILISIEAPTETFEDWRAEVADGLFADLSFGEPTGYTLAAPDPAHMGPHRVARTEAVAVDESRPTDEIARGGQVVVPSEDRRTLLLSVAYPSGAGGFDAMPADGSFPLVVVAPALRDAAIVLPADRLLASHGYVVVAVRFPESSYPGNTASGIPEQPADVRFVIDEVLSGALGPEITTAVDPDSIAVLGHSAGATTVFGLRARECCQDPRIDAFVAHAGTAFDFDSAPAVPTAPVLHIASSRDQIASAVALRDLHEADDGPSSFALLDRSPHLGWLDPTDPSFGPAVDLVVAWLATHLSDAPDTSQDVVDSSDAFVSFDPVD